MRVTKPFDVMLSEVSGRCTPTVVLLGQILQLRSQNDTSFAILNRVKYLVDVMQRLFHKARFFAYGLRMTLFC
jgi:hypothetical protein